MFQKLWPFNSSSQQSGPPQTHEPHDHGISTKVKPIHASFNKGVPLNMKIVIRGDIRTGKTSVFERLQGLPFRNEHEYKTTDQIQVANIPWQYPHTKDIIKVEVWDVVDKGIQSAELKALNNGVALKIDNNTRKARTISVKFYMNGSDCLI
ncbi:Rab-like protein 6 [Dissophora ornata]|nr:Rab-like protein 6 [Dissophora ornata]